MTNGIINLDAVGAFLHDEPVLVLPTAAGVLDGLDCGIKDAFDIAGHPTGFGNPTWRATHEVPDRHADAVVAVLANGAKIIGKTHTDELAFSLTGNNFHYGAPVNSAAPLRITGGSSCGSAAAVAAGLCDFSLGTDTGGSIRAPASFCGLYGFRPSHGVISMAGVCPLAPSFDTVGWFARDNTILEKVGAALLPDDARSMDLKRLTFVSDVWDALPDDMGKECAALAQATGNAAWGSLASIIGGRSLDDWFDTFRILQFHEIWQGLGPWIRAHRPVLGPGISERLKIAEGISAEEAAQASRDRQDLRNRLNDFLEAGSLLVIPTVPGVAPLRSSSAAAMEDYRRSAMRLLCIAGLCGVPQVSVPLLKAEGAPLGISLIGPFGSDRHLIETAAAIFGERAPPYPRHRFFA